MVTEMAMEILGSSPAITHLLRTLPMIALSEASVLIEGETGTGKELIAKALHFESRRKSKPFVTINCAVLPVERVEVDLFGKGDERGEITHRGRLLAAEGGTVFFDNVESLPLSIQAKVLRFLEAGECQLQGHHKLQVVDVRIVAASSADLQHLVDAGHFRSDLYYRLQVVPLRVPALRDRVDDILMLLRHFGRKFAGNNAVVRYSKETERCLLTYAWPGNIRELINFCQRMALLNPGKSLQPDDLASEMMPEAETDTHVFKLPMTGIKLAQVEVDLIEQALNLSAGNRSKAARLLGISRDTLLYRMQKHEL